jgi:hypothetical protein
MCGRTITPGSRSLPFLHLAYHSIFGVEVKIYVLQAGNNSHQLKHLVEAETC